MTGSRFMALGEVAALLGVKKSNTRKMLDRAGVVPLAPETEEGPVYRRREIEALKARRDADVRAREGDRKRREAARRRREGAPS